MTDRTDIIAGYRVYLAACNTRDWDELALHLAETILVNGQPQSRSEYIDNIRSTIATFPDYRWELRRTIVEGEWLAVHLHDVGTRTFPFLGAPGDGARVETDEFDMYRIVNGLIREVVGTADNARLAEPSPTDR